MSTLKAVPPRVVGNSGAVATWVAIALAFAVCAIPVLCVVGVTGYFRFSSDAGALRQTLMEAAPGVWEKKIALHVGGFTTGLVRYGSRLFNLPPEPRAALDALHGGEVGVYTLQQDLPMLKRSDLLPRADKLMRARGWERVVGVIEHNQTVAIYLPHHRTTSTRVKFCLFVLEEHELIIASAQGNLEPLLALAREHMPQDYRSALRL